MKFIHSDRTNASYTIIGKYIVNTNTRQIAEFGNDIEPVYSGVIGAFDLEKLTEAYKSNPDKFRNFTKQPYSIDELLKETDGNTFLLSVIGMESENLKTIKSLVNYGNAEIVRNMINSNYMVQTHPNLVDMVIKKYADDKELLFAFTHPSIIETLPNYTINRLYDIADPAITRQLIAFDRLSKRDLEPLFDSNSPTILKALAEFAPLDKNQRESFLHHENPEVQLAFRRREDITPEEDQYLWDNVVIRLQREEQGSQSKTLSQEPTTEEPSFKM